MIDQKISNIVKEFRDKFGSITGQNMPVGDLTQGEIESFLESSLQSIAKLAYEEGRELKGKEILEKIKPTFDLLLKLEMEGKILLSEEAKNAIDFFLEPN